MMQLFRLGEHFFFGSSLFHISASGNAFALMAEVELVMTR
jgi:hypothetical protein